MSFNKNKILFVYQVPLTFIEKDLDILKSAYEVREIRFNGFLDIISLFRGVFWCDDTFSWFGSIHAFFAVLYSKLLSKKSVVISGGHEVAYEPNMKYGMFSFWWKKWCPLFVFKYADLILSVSEFNRRETLENAKAGSVKVKHIYHGFDACKFQPIPDMQKEQLVITVGGIDQERLERKGYERFVRSATYLPDTQFVVVGKWHDNAIDYLRAIAPANMTFIGQVTDTDLLRWFSRAKVYVQASWHEAFGCSLAEAMLCECVPVVSRRAALPEVVGDCGFYVDELTPEAVAAKIQEALKSPGELGKKARERVKTYFPLEKRKEGLFRAINSLLEIR
jgi:glycosyltransferase involved in cell wall biosynthesis